MNALTLKDEEGRRRVRKVSGSSQASFDPGISEWGNPCVARHILHAEFIGMQRRPGEVKHLSTQRKRNHRDSLSSGERKGKSPNHINVVAEIG